MAEDKKAPAPPVSSGIPDSVWIFGLVAIMVLAGSFEISRRWGDGAWAESLIREQVAGLFSTLSLFLHFFALFASLIAIGVIVTSSLKAGELKGERLEELTSSVIKTGEVDTSEAPRNVKWQQIMEHINSDNPNDWKVAILEADTILDQILESMNYRGESIGEKLKQVEPSDFLTLDRAWEAHKIRNKIAHESGLPLSHRQAQRAVENYRAVFEEFQYI